MNDLLKQFQQSGQGDVANSWIGTGPNKAISPADSGEGARQRTDQGADGAGRNSSRDQLLAGLSEQLPELIDKLTPNGRLPTAQELSH